MLEVNNILISDDVVDAPFSCNLAACKGGCCVEGDSGAPLEESECSILDELLPTVKKYLPPEALMAIEQKGTWVETSDGKFATSCVNDAECVFVTYEGPVAKCAIQKAYFKGEIAFPKPISCHLFPLRATRQGEFEVLNYERIALCDSARQCGKRDNVELEEFLRDPLVRKYGRKWYDAFRVACKDRRGAMSSAV